jgi:hypothetical protein
MKKMKGEHFLKEKANSPPYKHRMYGDRGWYEVSLVLACFLALFYAFQSFYPSVMYVFSNVFPPFIAGAAFASSFLALARYWGSLKESFSLSWLSFASGLGLWFLGEVSWAVYTLLLGIELPYPSIADVFWISGYIPMLIALFLYVKKFLHAVSNRILYAVAVAVLALAVFMFLHSCKACLERR